MQARHTHQTPGLDKAEGGGEESHRIGADPEGYGQAGNSRLGAADSGGTRSSWGSSYGDFKPDRGAFGERQHGGHMGDYYAGGADPRGEPRHGHPEDFEADYHQWRADQLRQLDEDYQAWRQERYQKFSSEFGQWREQRQGAQPQQQPQPQQQQQQRQQQQQQQQPQSPTQDSRPQARTDQTAASPDPDAMATSGQQASLGYGGTGQERDSKGGTSGGAADGTSGASPVPRQQR